MIPAFLIKPLLAFAGVAALLAGAALWLHAHDNAVRAEMQASIDAATRRAEEADHARAVAALEASSAKAALRAASDAQIRGAIHAAPFTTSCARSGAVRAVIGGLRATGNGAGATSAGAGKHSDLSTATGATGR